MAILTMPKKPTRAIPTIITADITPAIITAVFCSWGRSWAPPIMPAVLAIAAVPSWQAAGALPAGNVTLDALVE